MSAEVSLALEIMLKAMPNPRLEKVPGMFPWFCAADHSTSGLYCGFFCVDSD